MSDIVKVSSGVDVPEFDIIEISEEIKILINQNYVVIQKFRFDIPENYMVLSKDEAIKIVRTILNYYGEKDG